MTRYISGLCVAGFGLCVAGWLMVAAFAFRGASAWDRAAVTNLATGAALAVVCVAMLACWSLAWRRKLRADGAVRTAPPAAPRPSPDNTEQLLAELRGLLAPLFTTLDMDAQSYACERATAERSPDRREPATVAAPSLRIPLDGEEAW